MFDKYLILILIGLILLCWLTTAGYLFTEPTPTLSLTSTNIASTNKVINPSSISKEIMRTSTLEEDIVNNMNFTKVDLPTIIPQYHPVLATSTGASLY